MLTTFRNRKLEKPLNYLSYDIVLEHDDTSESSEKESRKDPDENLPFRKSFYTMNETTEALSKSDVKAHTIIYIESSH